MNIIFEKSSILVKLPREVEVIFKIFSNNIRLVGGCVRDLLLNKKVNDYDFACIYSPQQTQEILNQNYIKSIPTGLKHGTITAIVNKFQFQITTLRVDLNHLGRDCDVNFTDDFFEDAQRRDFTINALYLDHNGLIQDYFNGIVDLQKQIVRFIGDPSQRIIEDHLRILRFFRFSCYYSSNIDFEGLYACLKLKDSLKYISKERVRDEFCKILNCPNINQLLNVIKIIHQHNFDKILWQLSIDFEALKSIFDYQKYIAQKKFYLTKILAIFWQNNFDKQLFYQNFKATNFEKKFIERYQLFSKNLNPTQLDFNLTNQFLIEYSKDELISFLIIFNTKNQLKIPQKLLENIILYIINKSIPLFPTNVNDLIAIGFSKYKLGEVIKYLKLLWANSDFTISNSDLLKNAQNFFNNYRDKS